MLLFTYQGKDWHSFTPSVCLTEVWKATADKWMVSKGMWFSQYAPKGVKSLCITSSQTVYVRKSDLVSSKTLERLEGLICKIYLDTYFQRARLGAWLICELGLYASMYHNWFVIGKRNHRENILKMPINYIRFQASTVSVANLKCFSNYFILVFSEFTIVLAPVINHCRLFL